MAIRSIVFSLGFLLFLGVGLFLVSAHSESAVAQDEGFQPRISTTHSSSFNTQASQRPVRISPPVSNPFEFKNTQLMRTQYLLPPDAAKTLKELFEHKSTSLVESRIVVDEATTKNGLVKFVVTAEPNTQQAIQSFVSRVFPREKLEEIAKANARKVSSAKAIPKSDLMYTVTLKLPNMTCGGCAASVKQFLNSKKLDKDCEVDLVNKTLTISTADSEHLMKVLKEAQSENKVFEHISIKTR